MYSDRLLEDLRALSKRIVLDVDPSLALDGSETALALARLFRQLDEYLLGGNPLPKAWNK